MEGESPCLKFNCHECCSPVKLREGFGEKKKDELASLPFRSRGEIVVPSHEEKPIRLETYDCDKLDRVTGKCMDYENRPKICRETKCAAFHATSEEEQEKIVQDIKAQEFTICRK